MATSEQSTVVGVFTDDAEADQAVDELRSVGFSDDEISVSRHGETTATTADDFMRMGVPELDAGYYQGELDAGRTIVLVRAAGLQEQALGILREHGAYDVTTRQP